MTQTSPVWLFTLLYIGPRLFNWNRIPNRIWPKIEQLGSISDRAYLTDEWCLWILVGIRYIRIYFCPFTCLFEYLNIIWRNEWKVIHLETVSILNCVESEMDTHKRTILKHKTLLYLKECKRFNNLYIYIYDMNMWIQFIFSRKPSNKSVLVFFVDFINLFL